MYPLGNLKLIKLPKKKERPLTPPPPHSPGKQNYIPRTPPLPEKFLDPRMDIYNKSFFKASTFVECPSFVLRMVFGVRYMVPKTQ